MYIYQYVIKQERKTNMTNETQKEYIERRRKEGASIKDIATELGMHFLTVRRRMQEFGLELPGKRGRPRKDKVPTLRKKNNVDSTTPITIHIEIDPSLSPIEIGKMIQKIIDEKQKG